jgi:phosphatidate cytidylyltransferase
MPNSSALHSNLAVRSIVGVVLGPLVMAAALAGGVWSAVLALLAGAVCAGEWAALSYPGRTRVVMFARTLACTGPLAALFVAALLRRQDAIIALDMACVGYVVAMVAALPFLARSALLAAGMAYAGVFAVSLVALGWEHPRQLGWLLAMVWASDVGAYAVGRVCGGPKLAPTVSPGKTWSGLGGAIACAALVGCLWGMPAGGRPWQGFLLGGAMGLLGQSADLLESALKRKAGHKDSGTLIPGHGGMLDRVDALMACSPFFLALALLYPGA